MNKDMKKVAIVTGATGDIGRAIVAEAIEQGYYVLAFGRDTVKLHEILESFGEQNVATFSVDLSDEDKLRDILSDVSMMFPHINLVIGSAGTFKWDDTFSGETDEEKKENAIKFLKEVNCDSKIRFDKILHKVYGNKISPLEVLVSSHITDPKKFSEKDIAEFKEVAYFTSMKGVDDFVLERRNDPTETWTYFGVNPGLIDTQMAREAFTQERIGRVIDWQMEATSPGMFAKDLFADIVIKSKKTA